MDEKDLILIVGTSAFIINHYMRKMHAQGEVLKARKLYMETTEVMYMGIPIEQEHALRGIIPQRVIILNCTDIEIGKLYRVWRLKRTYGTEIEFVSTHGM